DEPPVHLPGGASPGDEVTISYSSGGYAQTWTYRWVGSTGGGRWVLIRYEYFRATRSNLLIRRALRPSQPAWLFAVHKLQPSAWRALLLHPLRDKPEDVREQYERGPAMPMGPVRALENKGREPREAAPQPGSKPKMAWWAVQGSNL